MVLRVATRVLPRVRPTEREYTAIFNFLHPLIIAGPPISMFRSKPASVAARPAASRRAEQVANDYAFVCDEWN